MNMDVNAAGGGSALNAALEETRDAAANKAKESGAEQREGQGGGGGNGSIGSDNNAERAQEGLSVQA